MIVLSACQVFPGGVLPLHIFEPRYRAMLADALGSHRMFCIGARAPGAPEDSVAPGDIEPVSTAGLVRACVENNDGTSNLILEGIQRVRFDTWFEPQPYPVARVTALESHDPDPEKSANLVDSLLSLVSNAVPAEALAPLQEASTKGTPPGEVADFVAHHLIQAPDVRQQLLDSLDVNRRLEIALCHLHQTLSEPPPPATEQ